MLHTWSFIGPGPSFHGCQGQNVSSHQITTDNFHDWLGKVHLGWMSLPKMAIQYHVLGGLWTMVKSWVLVVYFEHSQGIYCQMGDDTNSRKRKQIAVEQMASCHEWKVVNLDFSKVFFHDAMQITKTGKWFERSCSKKLFIRFHYNKSPKMMTASIWELLSFHCFIFELQASRV